MVDITIEFRGFNKQFITRGHHPVHDSHLMASWGYGNASLLWMRGKRSRCIKLHESCTQRRQWAQNGSFWDIFFSMFEVKPTVSSRDFPLKIRPLKVIVICYYCLVNSCCHMVNITVKSCDISISRCWNHVTLWWTNSLQLKMAQSK